MTHSEKIKACAEDIWHMVPDGGEHNICDVLRHHFPEPVVSESVQAIAEKHYPDWMGGEAIKPYTGSTKPPERDILAADIQALIDKETARCEAICDEHEATFTKDNRDENWIGICRSIKLAIRERKGKP